MSATLFKIEHSSDNEELDSVISDSENGALLLYQFTFGAEKTREIVNASVKSKFPEIKRGDIVLVGQAATSISRALLIWNGSTVEDLATVADVYGHIPADYPVISEFPVNYWKEVITHNDLVSLTHHQFMDSNLSLHHAQIPGYSNGTGTSEPYNAYIWYLDSDHHVCFVSTEGALTEKMVRNVLASEKVLYCHTSTLGKFNERATFVDSKPISRLYVFMPYRLSGIDVCRIYERSDERSDDDESDKDSYDTDCSSDWAAEFTCVAAPE